MTTGALNPDVPVPAELENNVFITSLDKVYNWSRRNSIWPMVFGLACCAIEMMVSAASWDIARFGSEIFRPSPRQADLMIVSGTVTKKMAPIVAKEPQLLAIAFANKDEVLSPLWPKFFISQSTIKNHEQAHRLRY